MEERFGVFYVDAREANRLISGNTSYAKKEDAIKSIKERFESRKAKHKRYVVLPVYEEMN